MDEHDWFRAHLEPSAFDRLDEIEQQRFVRHALACPDCAHAMSSHPAHAPLAAMAGTHIPPRVLARWDREQHRLRGLPRRAVRQHLESCPDCRADLEATGFKPVLEPDAGLEDELAEARPPSGAPVPRLTVLPPPGRWRSWAGGALVGAALTTAAALAVVATVRSPGSLTGADATIDGPTDVASPPSAGRAAVPTDATPRLTVLPPVAQLSDRTRGSADEEAMLKIEPGTQFVHLALPDLFLADSNTVSIRIVEPDGRTRVDLRRRYEDLMRGRTLLLGSADRALAPGVYQVRIVTPYAADQPPTEFRLRLSH